MTQRIGYVNNSPKSKNKRIQSTLEALQRYGENPAVNLIRLARIAENQGDYALASTNWRELLGYIEAKRKPIDPIEQKEKMQRIATLEELSALKAAIIAGAATLIDEQGVIENQAVQDINEFV